MSCVSTGVRLATLVTIAAIAAASPARADDHAVDDAAYAPWHSPELGLALVAQPLQRAGIGTQEDAYGPGIELAFGRDRWQLVAEAALGYTTRDTGMMLMHPPGWVARAGGAIRWIARQYRPADEVATDFYLVGGIAAERSWWSDGTRIAEPDATVGFGMTVRALEHRIGVRIEVRVVFELGDDGTAPACRGTCPTAPANEPGLMGVWGLVW